jgi:hypothetical protein
LEIPSKEVAWTFDGTTEPSVVSKRRITRTSDGPDDNMCRGAHTNQATGFAGWAIWIGSLGSLVGLVGLRVGM